MTKQIATLVWVLLLSVATGSAQSIKPKAVLKHMQRVADWQVFHYRNTVGTNKKPHHPLDWTNAAMYTGVVKWAAMANDNKYYAWLYNIGREYDWKLYNRLYHADDHAVGQLYCELYRKYNDTALIGPTIRQFDYIINNPAKTQLTWQSPNHQNRWNWCDALFMSPPVWAKLYTITGQKKYLDFMVAEYKATTDFLFDKEENLYYRDQSYMGKLDHGTKIFWARGNGWVFAGLANILAELTPGTPEHDYFKDLFVKMAVRVKQLQTPQGHWAMSLLGAEFYPTPETSGSSFFIYGLAWGINNGILDKKTYQPAVKKGWNAMTSYITPEGMLGYVQPIGAAPGNAYPNQTEVYGTGAFLSAGSEVYKLYQ